MNDRKIVIVDRQEFFGAVITTSQDRAHLIIQLLRRDELVPLVAAPTFPPGAGQWFKAADQSIAICCLQCKQLAGLQPTVHRVEPDGCLDPSWICPICGWHAWVRLMEYR